MYEFYRIFNLLQHKSWENTVIMGLNITLLKNFLVMHFLVQNM